MPYIVALFNDANVTKYVKNVLPNVQNEGRGGGQNDCVLQIKIDDIERIRWMEKH